MGLDWPATVLLLLGYALLAGRPRASTLVIAVSDVFWLAYSVATGQVPLGIVSVFCGVFAIRAWVRWGARDPA